MASRWILGLVLLVLGSAPAGAQPAKMSGEPVIAAIVGNTLFDAKGGEYSFVDASGEMRSLRAEKVTSVKWSSKEGQFCIEDDGTICFAVELAGDVVTMVVMGNPVQLSLIRGNPKNL